jgi:hypothetical protein
MCVCLPGLVSGLVAQAEGISKLRVGIVEAVQPCVCAGEGATCPCLNRRVGQPVGRGHRVAARRGEVMPVPLPVEEGGHGPGELPGVGLVPGRGGVAYHGQQYPVFEGEPAHGLLLAGVAFRRDPGLCRPERQRVIRLGQQHGGGVRAVQVMVEDAAGCGTVLFFGVDSAGEMGRVIAQQVVEGEPAGNMLDEHAGLGQFGEQSSRRVGCQPGQASCGQCVRVLARVQAKQAEQLRGRGSQCLVGPGQDGAHIAGRIVIASECPPPLLHVAKLIGQQAQRNGRPHSSTGRHEGQCQGQPGAAVDDLPDRGGLGVHPVGAQPTA